MSYARKAVTRMTLDMSRVDLQRSETVTLQDTNRRWEVTLTNGGTPFRLPNNWTASLVGVKPDGYGLMLSCSVVDGRIIFDFAENEQLTTCEGAFPVQFDVWDEYGELVASPKIWLHVIRDTRPYEELESLCLYSTIGDLIAKEQENRTDIDENTEGVKANAADIEEINALLYGYREGEPAEGEKPGAVLASVKAVDQKAETNKTNITTNATAISENKKNISATSTALTALTSKINDPAHGLSAVETKLANFLDVSDDKRDQLSEVLSLISANEQAIQQFVSMGGAPVGSGTLVVPMDQWSDETPTGAMVALPANTMGAGSVMLLTPANDATKEAASKARLTVSVDISGDSGGNTKDYVVLLRAETAAKPAIDMEFAYVILQTTAATSLVTLIGVDAAGGTEPTVVDLSGFEGVEQEDGSIKGVIVETYADDTTRTTEVTYDAAGNIIKIGNTAINWGEDG